MLQHFRIFGLIALVTCQVPFNNYGNGLYGGNNLGYNGGWGAYNGYNGGGWPYGNGNSWGYGYGGRPCIPYNRGAYALNAPANVYPNYANGAFPFPNQWPVQTLDPVAKDAAKSNNIVKTAT